ncbi:MAG: NAD(P)/FAD-dependent oxidoreductase [Bacteroidales bacterium]|nr:NAD(P)/FAD-dependent oxidoreductase [Bacteroidales bacterium]
MIPKSNYDVVVIGAGPAGILAAGKCSSMGLSVALLEKMEKPARKLRITGKGRCNITNTKGYNDFFGAIKPNPRFLKKAFGEFFNVDIIRLLEENGLKTVEERGQRVFPASGKAWDVAETLIKWAKKQKVDIFPFCEATSLLIENGTINGVEVFIKDNSKPIKISAKAVIVATGGKSYPATGSTGDGYKFAQQAGHSIVDLRPSLTGLETSPTFLTCKGLTLRNTQVSIGIGEKTIASDFGELELTEHGLSGPTILKLSLQAIDSFISGQHVTIRIDLKPALSEQKLEARIQRDISKPGYTSVNDLLKGLLPMALAKELVKTIGVNPKMHAAQLKAGERKTLVKLLKQLEFKMTGYRSWPEAIVTAGGISLSEIESQTMMSKLCSGLFFAGEVIDLSGNTGGYNLQIAFSTGWLAGKSAGEYILNAKE